MVFNEYLDNDDYIFLHVLQTPCSYNHCMLKSHISFKSSFQKFELAPILCKRKAGSGAECTPLTPDLFLALLSRPSILFPILFAGFRRNGRWST
jgi:hypothetical protein